MSSVHVGSLSRLVRPTPPPRGLGIVVAVLLIMVETLLVYPLRQVMPPYSGGLVYIVGVLVASLVWGMWLGLATAVASTLAFVFFHVRPPRDVHRLGHPAGRRVGGAAHRRGAHECGGRPVPVARRPGPGVRAHR
ncbi:DUF4118 domain-containing protein [Dactylosporangium sp. CA-139114]|uniref:DUF4118 domain-containing protein n=1 Tax=Dactylosporangium sp. CA-139114 TaxID=3239931 RepID=UPI003D964066